MPSLLVTKSFVSPVSLLVSVTVTPGTTAPPADTVPRISPVFLLCENADADTNSRRHKASDQRMNLIMEFPHARSWSRPQRRVFDIARSDFPSRTPFLPKIA